MEPERRDELTAVNPIWRRAYRPVSLFLALLFAVVGLLFLFLPGGVLAFFNSLSSRLGFAEAPLQGAGLYLVLAVAYMYLATLLAFSMYRHPESAIFPLLLVNGKAASAILSFLCFFFHRPYLVFLANGVADGLIAAGVWLLSRKARSPGT
jgi:hypothetical protein